MDGEVWQWVGAFSGPGFFPGSWALLVALGQFAGPLRSTGGSPFRVLRGPSNTVPFAFRVSTGQFLLLPLIQPSHLGN